MQAGFNFEISRISCWKFLGGKDKGVCEY